jgi:hypothetical protein
MTKERRLRRLFVLTPDGSPTQLEDPPDDAISFDDVVRRIV